MTTEPVEVVNIKSENDANEEGLYYVESSDQIILMLWNGNALLKNGFVGRQALKDMGINDEQGFLRQWLTDVGYMAAADETDIDPGEPDVPEGFTGAGNAKE